MATTAKRSPAMKWTDEQVAAVLEALAEGIRAGVPIEQIESPVRNVTCEPERIGHAVFQDVRAALVQSRDYGSVNDRIMNGVGHVPWPVGLRSGPFKVAPHDPKAYWACLNDVP